MPIKLINIDKESKKNHKLKQFNPNDSPEDHVCAYSSLNQELSRICMAIDVSASQADCNSYGKGGRSLLSMFQHTQMSKMDTIDIYPFGDNNVMPHFESFSKFNATYYGMSAFNYSTYTKSLNNLLRNTSSYNKLIILGDGNFCGPYSSIQNETKIFLDNLKLCNLNSLQEIIILFSPHTTDSIIRSLKSSILEILSGKTDAVKFKCILLQNDTPDSITNIIMDTSSSVQIPVDHILVDDIFTFNKYLTDSSIIKVLSKTYPHLIQKLFKYIQSIIIEKPSLLNESGNVYSRLHNVLKSILGNEYKDWIGLRKMKATGKELEILTEFINSSFSKESECSQLIKELDKYCIGFLRIPDVSISKKELLKIIKDNSCMTLMKFVESILPNITFIKRKRGEPITNQGMIVIRPMKHNDPPEYRMLIRKALQTFLFQFGNYVIQGLRTYILGIIIMLAETTIPKVIYKMIYNAVFNDRDYTFKMLGLNIKMGYEDELDIQDSLWTPDIMKLISNCIISFPDKMFDQIGKPGLSYSGLGLGLEPEPEPVSEYSNSVGFLREQHIHNSIKGLIDQMTTFNRLHNIIGTYRSIKPHITRVIKIYEDKLSIKVGDMLSVNPWKHETQPNLPAIVIVREILSDPTKPLPLFLSEYLDKKFNTADTYRLHPNNIQLICKQPSQYLITLINNHLIDLQCRGEKGLLGTNMLKIALRTGLRLKNDNIILKMIKENHPPDKLGFTERNTRIDIPADIVLQIIKPHIKANDHLIRILKSGDKITKKNTIEASHIDMLSNNIPQIKIYSFTHSKNKIVIIPKEVNMILKTFSDRLISPKLTGSTGSNMRTCACCWEISHFKTMYHFKRCQHSICSDCRKHYVHNTKYTHGSIVNKELHSCSVCQVVDCDDEQILAVYEKYGGSIPGKIALRYCYRCPKLFEYELTCGGDNSYIPDTCIDCRVVDDTSVECPYCGILVSKTEGCDHMECICGGHWCWGCRWKFTDGIIPLLGGINWICAKDCSEENEIRYIDDPDFEEYDSW